MPTLLLLVLLPGVAAAMGRGARNGVLNELLEHRRVSSRSPSSHPSAEWFLQPLDHFNMGPGLADNRTWLQRYFKNETFWGGDGYPIFIMIGGEGPISPRYTESFYYTTYAKQYGALMLAPEHRFYGESQPTGGRLTVADLRYLSSAQALADLASFRDGMVAKLGAHRSPVVVFGGSYPGSLSAWFKEKYPHLAVGSVSSSAPLRSKMDFYEYLEVVAEALEYFGGSACTKVVSAATSALHAVLTSTDPAEQRDALRKFRVCGVSNPSATFTPDDLANFVSAVAGNIMGVVQYNNEGSGNRTNAAKVCGLLTANASQPALDAYAELNGYFLDASNTTCDGADPSSPIGLNISYAASVAELRITNATRMPATRQWIWQTCREFGWYQTTSSPTSRVFGPPRPNDDYPLPYSLQLCRDIFSDDAFVPSAAPPSSTATPTSSWFDRNAAASNTRYGSTSIATANTIFVHGTIDPWHAMGVTPAMIAANGNTAVDTTSYPDLAVGNDPAHDVTAVLVTGTAHCANMEPPSPHDPPQLWTARRLVGEAIGRWVSGGKSPPAPTPTPAPAPPPPPAPAPSGAVLGGAVVGGVALGAFLATVVAVLLWRRRQRGEGSPQDGYRSLG